MIRKKRNRPKQKNVLVYIPTLVCLCLVFVFLIFQSFFIKSWNFNWHGIHLELRDNVKYLEGGYWTTSHFDDYEQYQKDLVARKYLLNNSSNTELEILADYPDAVIRTLAYNGLVRREIPNKVKWIEKALNDTCDFVILSMGCRDHVTTISEMLFDYYVYNPEITEENKIKNFQAMYGLTKKEAEEMFALYKKRGEKRDEYIEKYREY